MADEMRMVKLPAAPEYNNSAGRLIRLIEMLVSQTSFIDLAASFFAVDGRVHQHIKLIAFGKFSNLLSASYDQFINDVREADSIPEATKSVIFSGLTRITDIIYPLNPQAAPRQIQEAEIALLRMTATILQQEELLNESDIDKIRKSVAAFEQTIDSSDIPKQVKISLLEIVRLTNNAISQFNIYGARGFRVAFKNMLAELMEVYLKEGDKKLKDSVWWKKGIEHLKVIDEIAGRILKYKPLLESVSPLLIGGITT